MQGYARLNKAEAALDVMREFWQQGGEPDDSMFEVLVNLCVRTGEFRKALQVWLTQQDHVPIRMIAISMWI